MSKAPQKVLIIEDEPKIANLVKDFLSLDGYESTLVHDGALALEAVHSYQPDCVILDLMLPNIDGLTICKEIRSFSNVPIIMLTARVDEIDRLKGLKSGADDYVCKPFSAKEVVARVESVLRRSALNFAANSSENIFSYKDITLNLDQFTCLVNKQAIELTPVEFRLLLAMIKKPSVVFSRETLMNHCYDDQRIVSDRTIDSHMKNLRHKLTAQTNNEQFIQAVYGVGYKLQ